MGQTLRFANNKNEDINEGTVTMIQNVFKEKYPQEAIDKYISVMRQLYSKNPEEKEQGNVSGFNDNLNQIVTTFPPSCKQFEAAVLLVEGALYRTESERFMRSGSVGIYDVRSALERFEEASNSENDSMELTESTIEQFKADLATEFPSEVGELIGSIFMKAIKAETLAEQKKAAVSLIFTFF